MLVVFIIWAVTFGCFQWYRNTRKDPVIDMLRSNGDDTYLGGSKGTPYYFKNAGRVIADTMSYDDFRSFNRFANAQVDDRISLLDNTDEYKSDLLYDVINSIGYKFWCEKREKGLAIIETVINFTGLCLLHAVMPEYDDFGEENSIIVSFMFGVMWVYVRYSFLIGHLLTTDGKFKYLANALEYVKSKDNAKL